MNDFTKDELNELLSGYEFHEHNTRHNWPSLDLIKKIEYMIDNHCEHEYAKATHECIDCGVSEYRCNECGHVSYEGL